MNTWPTASEQWNLGLSLLFVVSVSFLLGDLSLYLFLRFLFKPFIKQFFLDLIEKKNSLLKIPNYQGYGFCIYWLQKLSMYVYFFTTSEYLFFNECVQYFHTFGPRCWEYLWCETSEDSLGTISLEVGRGWRWARPENWPYNVFQFKWCPLRGNVDLVLINSQFQLRYIWKIMECWPYMENWLSSSILSQKRKFFLCCHRMSQAQI